MKYITFFIASSAELKEERDELADLLEDLSQDKYVVQGVRLKAELWEYVDSSVRADRKEDEYLDMLRKSDVCIVLFWQTLGRYTVEELNVAVAEMKAGRKPKSVCVLYKEPTNVISAEMAEFKAHFTENYPSLSVDIFGDYKQLREKVTSLVSTYLILS